MIETNKEIRFDNEARMSVKTGINKACKAVAPTLGVVGMTALIDWEGLDPIVSDDGITILKNLQFKDRYENMGLKMLRKGALRTSLEGGDGTASTTVLTNALVDAAFRSVGTDNSKVREVYNRLQKGREEIIAQLREMKRDVTDEDIERIANISTLDPEASKVIADTIKEVGVHGIVTIEKGSQIGIFKDVVKGAKFDSGYLSQYFINEFEGNTSVLENPYIVLIDRKVSLNEQIKSIMTSIENTGHFSVLIIADDVQGAALASLGQASTSVRTIRPDGTAVQGKFKIACVKNPYNGSRGKDFLFDLAALTGATVISEEVGMKLTEANVSQCGRAEKVIVTKDSCTIIGGTPSDALPERIKAIESDIAATTSEYSKAMLKERLACLAGGIGIIRVGTYTDTEYHAKKLKFQNGVNAAQAALQEGILPGGGTALARVKVSDPIFKTTLVASLKQQAENAGFDKHSMAFTIQQSEDKEAGYNFKTGELVNMFAAGIIDPLKVVRLQVESAVAIACDTITTATAIVKEDEPVK